MTVYWPAFFGSFLFFAIGYAFLRTRVGPAYAELLTRKASGKPSLAITTWAVRAVGLWAGVLGTVVLVLSLLNLDW